MKVRGRNALIWLAAWSAIGLIFAGQTYLDSFYTGRRLAVSQALVLALAGWYGWALLSPLVAWLARRASLLRPGTRARALVIHLGCSLVLTVIKIAVTVQLLRSSGLATRTMGSAASLSITFTTYWIIIGAVYGIDAVRAAGEARIRTARLEAELANARLEVLSARLHPHFLFNCLHSIAELMHRDVDAADLAIERVAELLRAALETSRSREIALRDELALIDRYVSIERIRFEDRLRVCYEAAPETLDAYIPVLLLQPLIENAIRHAVATRPDGASIHVRSARQGQRLRIEIEDEGPGFDRAQLDPDRWGFGLRSTRSRLEALFGSDQCIELAGGPGGGAKVRIEMPFRLEGAA